ncbi:MAG: 2-oxoglutarate dehydrogenase E1 component, partial [Ferruginibacter sp.]
MKDFQYITNAHPAYIESLYNDFIKNPESVDVDMRSFFEGFDFAVSNYNTNGNGSGKPAATNGVTAVKVPTDTVQLDREFSVYQLILAYRRKGHLIASTNPIRERKDRMANLGLENFGFSEADLATEFEAGKFVGLGKTSLKNIVAHLQK